MYIRPTGVISAKDTTLTFEVITYVDVLTYWLTNQLLSPTLPTVLARIIHMIGSIAAMSLL